METNVCLEMNKPLIQKLEDPTSLENNPEKPSNSDYRKGNINKPKNPLYFILGVVASAVLLVLSFSLIYTTSFSSLNISSVLNSNTPSNNHQDIHTQSKEKPIDVDTGDEYTFGKFLHLTDIHIDPNYREGTGVNNFCHFEPDNKNIETFKSEKKNQIKSANNTFTKPLYLKLYPAVKNRQGSALRFGTPYERCDTPELLLDAATSYISSEILQEIDFTVLTGDNCRHDNDEYFPMSNERIVEQQKLVFGKMRSVFDNKSPLNQNKKQIKVVFSIGNNDMYPHNKLSGKIGKTKSRDLYKLLYELLSGESISDNNAKETVNNNLDINVSTKVTRWIEKTQKEVFLKNGYYSTDIENTPFRIISLNTMYFYVENKKVGGCVSPNSSGLAHLGWLRHELKIAEKLGKKVIIIGHIHPQKGYYRKTCLKEYTRTISKFSHIIKSQMFGHVNKDAWVFLKAPKNKDISRFNKHHYLCSEKEWEKRVDRGEKWWLNEDLIDEDISETPEEYSNLKKINSSLKKNKIDSFIGDVLDQFQSIVDSKIDPSRLSVAMVSHSIIPRFQPGFKVIKYAKSTIQSQKTPEIGVLASIKSAYRYFRKLVSNTFCPNSSYSHQISELRNDPVGTFIDYDVYWLNLTYAHESAQMGIKNKNEQKVMDGNDANKKYKKIHLKNRLNIKGITKSFQNEQNGGFEGDLPQFEFLYSASQAWGMKNLTSSEYLNLAKTILESKDRKKLFEQMATLGKDITKHFQI
ncbi:hypothetical protein BB559_004314 [Furculomyces boomerangus]|uniref:Uncharacterized protein n=2 Tax=Furculomyces boomerangus TaxID=61424 RepID=A0A2T9YFH5_9FUNG|nr:hypothetical protein BB559_004314 [Furculomyces boomerangus]